MTMKQITVDRFEIEIARTDLNTVAHELEKLFAALEDGKIPTDLATVKRFTLEKARKRNARLLELEAEAALQATH
jgi:predicted transcriptional regulator